MAPHRGPVRAPSSFPFPVRFHKKRQQMTNADTDHLTAEEAGHG